MEGVIDHRMRRMLTALGGYDRCVTEFVRVTNTRVPLKVFRRLCPELDQGGVTESGTPVYVQLLGGNPSLIAASAQVAVRAGAPGIDLNFGCPTKTVNRHDGGSVLLKEPHRVGDIVAAVRDAVDPDIPVCAKIRLGFEDSDNLLSNVQAVYQAGANEICIHARTKINGYKPPAYWSVLQDLPRTPHTRLIVNGEIWTPEDADSALRQSGCEHLMIGRGGLAQPDLALQIRAQRSSRAHYHPLPWTETVALVDRFYHDNDSGNLKYAGNRTKQWLGYLRKFYPDAQTLFESIKRLSDIHDISKTIRLHRKTLEQPGSLSAAA